MNKRILLNFIQRLLLILKFMSHFNKKPKNDPSFNTHFNESSVSVSEDCLIVNSSIFNKSANPSQNQKLCHSQNHPKSPSTTSYLKNFKKNYRKNNQQNMLAGESSRQDQSFNKQSFVKKEYENMMNDLMGGRLMQENNKNSSSKPCNQVQKHSKSKVTSDEDKKQNRNKTDISLTNHLFMNDQSQQSMEELLNSSINQFERFLEQEQQASEKAAYEKSQNMNVKKTLTKFKSILKEKLQHGLNKQKQQMKCMLNQYVELITKLLHDKQELSNHIEELEQELSCKNSDVGHLQRKVQEINKEKDDHIQKTKHQIDQFLVIIEQFQNQTKEENQRIFDMERQIQRLRPFEQKAKSLHSMSMPSHKKYSSQDFQEQEKRIECQSQKIQTLLELLEKSQQETNTLKEILAKQNSQISSLRKQPAQRSSYHRSQSSKNSQQNLNHFTQQQVDQMKAFYEQKLQELEIQHQEQFIQYEKAIKQTLTKKDQCIHRLNFIISELREGKKSAARGKSHDGARQKGSSDVENSKFIQKQNRHAFDQEMNSMNENTFNDEEPIEQEESIRC